MALGALPVSMYTSENHLQTPQHHEVTHQRHLSCIRSPQTCQAGHCWNTACVGSSVYPKAPIVWVSSTAPKEQRVLTSSALTAWRAECESPGGQQPDCLGVLYAELTWGRSSHTAVTVNSKLLQRAKRQKRFKVIRPKPYSVVCNHY